MAVTTPDLSPAAALQSAIAACAAQGWRLQSVNANTAAMTYGSEVNHALHGILSVLTCGAWLLIWFFLVVGTRKHSMLILVDEAGTVSYQQQT